MLSLCLSIGCLPDAAFAEVVDSRAGAAVPASSAEGGFAPDDTGRQGEPVSGGLPAAGVSDLELAGGSLAEDEAPSRVAGEAAPSAPSANGEVPLQPASAENAEAVSDAGSEQMGSASAELKYARIEDGFYTIRSAIDSSFVLDVQAASNAAGANVQLWEGNGSAAQTWYISGDADGSYTIESVCSGLFLDVQWASRGVGANVWQYSASSTPAQKWRLVERTPEASHEAG